MPIRTAGRSKASVCSAHVLELRIRIASGHGYLSVVSVVCCHVEVSAAARSHVRKIRTECGVTDCDHRTFTLWRPMSTRAVEPYKKEGKIQLNLSLC